MFKLGRLLLLLAVGLTACVARDQVTPTRLPPTAIPFTQVVPGTSTPTVTPSATPTDVPPTSTPEISTLNDDVLRDQVDRLAAGFLRSTRNPGLSVSVVLRDPGSGQLKAMLLNYGTAFRDGADPVNSDTVY